MERLKLALVSLEPDKNLEANLRKIRGFVLEAVKAGAELVCFPEASIQGYGKGVEAIGLEDLENFLENLRRISQQFSIGIILGFIERNQDLPYISQLIIGPKTTGIYRKTHLGEGEKDYFSPGDSLDVFEFSGIRLAIQLCWESHFPELSTIQALKGADLILFPYASPSRNRRAIWAKTLVARAYDNSVFVAACNQAGGLMVIDPKGEIIAENFEGGDRLIFTELDLGYLEKIRRGNSMANRHYLKSRRPELYGELCMKLEKKGEKNAGK